MGLLDAAKRLAGKVIGSVGNVAQQVTSKVIPGKQIVPGGITAQMQILGRNLNPVKTANAAELPPAPKSTPPPPSSTPPPSGGSKPSGGTNQQPQPQPQPQPQQNYDVPSPSEAGVPSSEDRANKSAEERMRRYGEVVTPIQNDIESYLSSRPSIVDLFKNQMTEQGVDTRKSNLDLLEGQVKQVGTQLNTIPNEEIARRKETGMLTSAAERRIRAKEEAPYREQLLKTTDAANQERIGLDRAYSLVDKYLDVLREQETRDMEPLQSRLEGAQGEFSEEVKGMADKLTGFKADREAKLIEYEKQIASDVALSTAQRKEASDLKLEEAKHLNTMEEISAREKGQDASLTTPEQLEEFKTDVMSMNNEGLVSKWGEIMGVDSLNYLLKKYQTVIPNGSGGGSISDSL